MVNRSGVSGVTPANWAAAPTAVSRALRLPVPSVTMTSASATRSCRSPAEHPGRRFPRARGISGTAEHPRNVQLHPGCAGRDASGTN
jgi:hypothetical protein